MEAGSQTMLQSTSALHPPPALFGRKRVSPIAMGDPGAPPPRPPATFKKVDETFVLPYCLSRKTGEGFSRGNRPRPQNTSRGSPLSASLPTFFAIKKVGAARPERKESDLDVRKHQSGKAGKCTQGFYREPLLACGFPNRASCFSGPPSPSCPFGGKGVSRSAERESGRCPDTLPLLKKWTKLSI